MILNHNSIYLSGNTASKNFPVTPGSYDTSFNGGTNEWGGDAFITKFILSDSTTSVGKSGSNIPENIRLNQNYPNPFNPSTMILYSLAKSSFVKLSIYNLLGQNIRTLQNSFQSAGKHSLVWDAMDETNNPVSSGIYFYRLQTEELTLQKKMLLLR
jgi:flagellar hook assembly protein FlgD